MYIEKISRRSYESICDERKSWKVIHDLSSTESFPRKVHVIALMMNVSVGKYMSQEAKEEDSL